MLLRLNLIVAVFLVALLLFGSSYVSSYTSPYVPEDDFFIQSVAIYQYKVNGVIYYMTKDDELMYYAEKGLTASTWYCKVFDSDTSQCKYNEMLLYDKLHELDPSLGEWHSHIYKQDVAAFYPSEIPFTYFLTDVLNFNFAAYSLFSSTAQHPKILITIHLGLSFFQRLHQKTNLIQYQVIFEDPQNTCPGYSVNERQMLNFHLYVNRKYNKYAYYFIKSGNKICAYTLKHENLFHVRQLNDTTAPTIQHIKFVLINMIQTEYYAQNFYCVDPIYGTFVMLYWDKQPGHPPEAHFYIINENNLQNFYLIDQKPLYNFDETVLRAIFNNEFDSDWYPAFTSYGGQIFVWFKLRNKKRAFNGFWSSRSSQVRRHKVFFETVDGAPEKQKTWHARKEYIQYDKPVGRHDATLLPPTMAFPGPTSLPQTTQEPTTLPPPTTPKATTTTERTTTTTTLPSSTTPVVVTTTKKTTVLPSTTAAAPSTPPPSTTTSKATSRGTMPPITSMSPTATTTVENTTSDSSNTTNNGTNYGHASPSIVPAMNNSTADSLGGYDNCSNDDLYLYLLIVLIVVIVMEVIVLVILIILKFRGAKKMKEAEMAQTQSKSVIKKKPSPKAKSKKKGKKIPSPKESKKSTKEKAAASKTKDAGKKTATTQLSADQTNYYTVGQTFNKSSKKNKKLKR